MAYNIYCVNVVGAKIQMYTCGVSGAKLLTLCGVYCNTSGNYVTNFAIFALNLPKRITNFAHSQNQTLQTPFKLTCNHTDTSTFRGATETDEKFRMMRN